MQNNIKIASSLILATSAIAGALVLQHGFGYQPCGLCLEQRDPYYFGIPLMVTILVLPFLLGRNQRAVDLISRILSAVVLLLFAYGAYKGGYHAGAEWKWWPGPDNCAVNVGKGANSAAELLEIIKNTAHVSCTDASLRILGLSLAGWNVIVSSAICASIIATLKQHKGK